jgi:proteasome activator subunit 4
LSKNNPFGQFKPKNQEMQTTDNLRFCFLQVRTCVSLNLRSLNEAETQPSFRDLSSFLEACRAGTDEPLLVDHTLLNEVLPNLFKDLEKFRKLRLPAQHGDQEYDKCSMTILAWLWSCLSDVQAVSHGSGA